MRNIAKDLSKNTRHRCSLEHNSGLLTTPLLYLIICYSRSKTVIILIWGSFNLLVNKLRFNRVSKRATLSTTSQERCTRAVYTKPPTCSPWGYVPDSLETLLRRGPTLLSLFPLIFSQLHIYTNSITMTLPLDTARILQICMEGTWKLSSTQKDE
jgi:hypothetical protein